MNTDLVAMIGNISQSLFPVQSLISGLAYLLGILFFINAIAKLRKIGDARARSSSHEKMFVPIAYILGASALLYLPSALQALSVTAFGTGNILGYMASYNKLDITDSMQVVIQTAGLIWFVRGCVLLVHSSDPSFKQGPKGLAFLCAGVLAMNFEATVSTVNGIISRLEDLTMAVKNSQGY